MFWREECPVPREVLLPVFPSSDLEGGRNLTGVGSHILHVDTEVSRQLASKVCTRGKAGR